MNDRVESPFNNWHDTAHAREAGVPRALQLHCAVAAGARGRAPGRATMFLAVLVDPWTVIVVGLVLAIGIPTTVIVLLVKILRRVPPRSASGLPVERSDAG